MQCKLFKGPSPDALEKSINDWLAGIIATDAFSTNPPAKVWIHNVQQYTIGSVARTTVFNQPGAPPPVEYSFCLLVFYSISS
jgi:hypothetical protein